MLTKLNINVRSFSYKKGVPADLSGNGGGFVFDCRGILNPGRIEEYKTKTGRDTEVMQYLETQTRILEFIEGVLKVINITIKDYSERGFSNLEINFGCTGGQHRSVYSADKVADYIRENYPKTNVNVEHVEQEVKNWVNQTY